MKTYKLTKKEIKELNQKVVKEILKELKQAGKQ